MSDFCTKCGGTGYQPDGWTLTDARANPKAYNDHRLEAEHGPGHGVMTLLNVVSPLQFLDNGRERCVACSGTGITLEAMMRKSQEIKDKRITYFRNLIGGTEEIELPEGYMFLTITAYFNDSDTMSDYFAPHRSLSDSYVIGIKKKGKRTEKAARDVVNAIPELSKLSWRWLKADYSGGHGTWLQSEIVGEYPHKCYDGRAEASYWYEISFGLYGTKGVKSKFFGGTKPVKVVENDVKLSDVVIRKNEEKNGIEILFPAKPGPDVLVFLKGLGFRWSQAQGIWWRKFDDAVLEKVKVQLAA